MVNGLCLCPVAIASRQFDPGGVQPQAEALRSLSVWRLGCA